MCSPTTWAQPRGEPRLPGVPAPGQPRAARAPTRRPWYDRRAQRWRPPRAPPGSTSAPSRDADLIVSAPRTPAAPDGAAGSTAERLLHGRPARSPWRPTATRSVRQPAVIGCAYDGSPSSRRALEEAGRLAAATGRSCGHPGLRAADATTSRRPAARSADGLVQRHAARRAPRSPRPRSRRSRPTATRTSSGRPPGARARRTRPGAHLLSGSRGYGPMHAVWSAASPGQLVREAACPVIVFPRSAGDAEDDSLFATDRVGPRLAESLLRR